MTKRHRPPTFRREMVTLTPEQAQEYLSGGRGCAWEGCRNICKGDLPPDWINLITYWTPQPQAHLTVAEIATSPFCTRDVVLCAEHARQLESLLYPLPDPRIDDPGGEA